MRMHMCILATRCTVSSVHAVITLEALLFHTMEQRRQIIRQQRAQESAEQCHRLDRQKLHDHTREESPEEAEYRTAHREAQRRYRQALLARETTEQTQQCLETECRRIRQVRASETNEVSRLRLNAQNSRGRTSRAL